MVGSSPILPFHSSTRNLYCLMTTVLAFSITTPGCGVFIASNKINAFGRDQTLFPAKVFTVDTGWVSGDFHIKFYIFFNLIL